MAPSHDPVGEGPPAGHGGGRTSGIDHAARWVPALPPDYRDSGDAEVLADDVAALARFAADPGPAGLRISFRAETAGGAVAATGPASVVATAVTAGAPLELSRVVPVFEQLGFRVVDSQHWPVDGLRLHRFGLLLPGDPVAVEEAGTRWAEAVEVAWAGRTAVDDLGRLVTRAGLGWRDVALLRGLAAHRRQVDRYPLDVVADALCRHPELAAGLVELFAARLHPDRRDPDRADALAGELAARCDDVEAIEDDRILRGLLRTVAATTRTTWFSRADGLLAVKLDPRLIPGLPDPVPAHEAWVHGPLPAGGVVQGIHLRAGDVARGGLRWSDRAHDLRAEVLDLMRTQVLKNAPIVPTGAKGGFVVRDAPVAEAYDAFVGSLLDLTDNRDRHGVVPVPGRLDGDDPYLVVAADRGTASFSDRANALALERGFWLGDAFASGGSNGYDHKALGVTARGAWEATVHHFAALDVDPRVDEISMVGVGDLSGDVFGNFAVRSPHLRLVAAFDHRHVFCDPDPDPAASFAERTRIAALARSSWDDYDRSLLSPGGFVVPRTQKRVELGPEVRAALRTEAEVVDVAELIRLVLRAPVDLLFFGGIGTFVRAADEEDVTVDDRANAELRVEAEDLRARVLVEGANLAVTQRGRIAYSRRGGRVNRDAIDNAAGVDTSDHEVNIKILLDAAVQSGDIDAPGRSALLLEHTDDVVDHVLARTRRQCERLSISVAYTSSRSAWFERVLHELVADGVLDPEVEDLPDGEELDRRRAAGAGLTRPELAVMLAGTKRWLTGQILGSDLPDQPGARPYLVDAFPDALSARFDHLLERHPLRRELVASDITNEIVDRLGMTFVHRIAHDTGSAPAAVAAAALVATGVVDAGRWWPRLADPPAGALLAPDAGDPRRLLVDLCDQLARAELVRAAGGRIDVAGRVATLRPVLQEMAAALGRHASRDQREAHRARTRLLVEAGWPEDLASNAALLPDLTPVTDVADLSRELNRPAGDLVAAYAALDDRLRLVRMTRDVEALRLDDRWQQAAQHGVLDDLAALGRDVLRAAIAERPSFDGHRAVSEHLDDRAGELADALRFCDEARSDPTAGLAGLWVATRALRRAV